MLQRAVHYKLPDVSEAPVASMLMV